MKNRLPFAVLGTVAMGLVLWLPACAAPGPDEQIIGPAPTVGCCWGSVPDHGSPNFAMPIEIASPALAALPVRHADLHHADWNRGQGAD